MERFNSIYPFTTENIAGYMKNLDFNNKRIITVTGSGDHIINAITNGSKDITTFDINPLTKFYLDLKLRAIRELPYEEFLQVFFFDKSIQSSLISKLNMPYESEMFWINQLLLCNNDWNELKNSSLFNKEHFNPNSKLWENLYLEKKSYEKTRKLIDEVKITFINTSLKDLVLDQEFDYMFLSNISDYLNLMYNSNPLENYRDLLFQLLKNVQQIYFAYLYDIENNNLRSDIDDLNKVKTVFKEFKKETFRSALENQKNKKDGVLILRRN